MDDEDRFSASSPESERQNEPDEVMEDADEGENDAEQDDDNNDEDDENNDDDNDANDGEDGGDETQNTITNGSAVKSSKSGTPVPVVSKPYLRPSIRPEAITARLYDIVPTMAAPQSTSVNAMAITPDLRYWITGGSDGYIRKYDGPGTINGKLALTVAQKHPFVDSVTKAGILMSYWENEEPAAPGRGDQDHNLSPVYSLAVHSEALWLLSGLESGGINLQSVRHDEGKRIACLQQHTNAVSSLMLAPDERSVLSGGWDKNIFDWDLNTGQTIRSFDGSGGQISSIELRPASGDPVPAEADEPIHSTTISTNNDAPLTNGVLQDEPSAVDAVRNDDGFAASEREGDDASPAHESLFGGSDAGSLFGETAGEQPFGNDDDGFGASMDMMPGHEGGMDHSADFAMADMETKEPDGGGASTLQAQVKASQPSQDVMDVDGRPAEMNQAPAPTADPAAAPRVEAVTTTQPDEPSRDEENIMAQLAEDKEALKRSQSPGLTVAQPVSQHFDQSQTSATTFLSSAIDGTIRIWDRRVPNAVARIGTRAGVPPWCMSACWSPDGNMIYTGRRNGTVEEYDLRKAKRGWEPERALRFPTGSGAVSALRSMPNGRHLVCASHDILRLYDLRDTRAFKHSTVPFLIIPGPPRAGVISSLYIDPTSRFMLSAAGTRGWEGSSTEVLIGYEIHVVNE
ncbi:hypothetical protein C2857_000153 [Epichloe festucae Fl1]|uniref:Transcription factor spt8 beta-propeller domain-containing protein n=1 Tax=Epichloe festucae (strain Fl1) TaxID=877507 RepID=A0A7S9KJC3_EPIFF|nr:hypothetical protein C2857_000153 [Epichloe festucae Fl1]